MLEKFEKMLDEALENELKMGKMVGSNKDPEDVELEGKKKKSADAAHKPLDPGVEYTQLEQQLDFDNKDHETSEQGRPGLSR